MPERLLLASFSAVTFLVFILPFMFERELPTPHGVTTPAGRR